MRLGLCLMSLELIVFGVKREGGLGGGGGNWWQGYKMVELSFTPTKVGG